MILKYPFEFPWVVFVAYWLIAALKTKRTRKKEPFAWRYGVMFVEIIGFTLMFDGDAGIGVLGHKVFLRSFYSAVARCRAPRNESIKDTPLPHATDFPVQSQSAAPVLLLQCSGW
jgi:hypothetical protein